MEDVNDLFAVRTFHENGAVRLVLSGELDIATAPRLEQAVAQALGSPLRALTVDVSEVTFVDVRGQRSLSDAASSASSAGIRFELRGASESFRRVVRLVGFERLEDACEIGSG
jgi:anti-sigma B factor antagonist